MKKIILTVTVTAMTVLFMPANAGAGRIKMDKEARKERREERRELWLHSANPITAIQFRADFPGAKDVSWTQGEFAEASFLDGTIQKTAYYDADNTLVGTTVLTDYSALPQKAQKRIEKNYPGYTVEKLILFDDNEANESDMILFHSPFEDADNYFAVLSNGSKKIILEVSMDGNVSFFENYK